MRLRDLSLKVNSEATLVDVRGYPPLPHTFSLVDDQGMCREVHAHPSKGEHEAYYMIVPKSPDNSHSGWRNIR